MMFVKFMFLLWSIQKIRVILPIKNTEIMFLYSCSCLVNCIFLLHLCILIVKLRIIQIWKLISKLFHKWTCILLLWMFNSVSTMLSITKWCITSPFKFRFNIFLIIFITSIIEALQIFSASTIAALQIFLVISLSILIISLS